MKTKRYFKLILGQLIFSIGIVMTMQANLGLAPWDAFHTGLTYITGLTFGTISIIVGIIIVLFTYQFGEPIGIGTIANTILIGVFIDLIYYFDLIPLMESLLPGIIMMIVGMILIAFASYFYISSGFGSGPRDGLMVVLTKLTHLPVGLIRSLIELSVFVIGWLLGAKIGLGTAIIAFGIGPVVHLTFHLLKFDVSKIEHNAILQKKSQIDATVEE